MIKFSRRSIALAFAAVFSGTSLNALGAVDDANDFKHNTSLSTAKTLDGEVMLFDFESKKIPSSIGSNNADLGLDTNQPISGERSLTVYFNTKENNASSIVIRPETPFDWSSYKDFHLAWEVTNSGTESVQIDLNIGDKNGDFYTRGIAVGVGETKTVYAKMDGHDQVDPPWATRTEFNFSSGFRSNPVTWESGDHQFYSFWGKKRLDLTGITAISLNAVGLVSDRQIKIDNIRLRPNPKMDKDFLVGLIDKYGQNAKADYEDKVNNDEHLAQIVADEMATLSGEKLPDRSKFHGWKDGPRFEGTGFFRTQKVKGKWAIIDPEGYLYFSTGIDIIRLSNSSTMTGYDFDDEYIPKRSADETVAEDDQPLNRVADKALHSRKIINDTRANLFEWLPSYDDPLGNHFGYRREAQSGPQKRGETYSFYSANLERRYGETYKESYLDTWRSVTVRRMLDWGYTSLGNWSQEQYYGNNQIPFVAFADIIGEFGTLSSGFDFWHGVPDAYDPRFRARAVAAAEHVAGQINNTPWCMGIFMDNEQSFGRGGSDELYYGIVFNTLKQDATQVPAKAAFTKILKEKYKSIKKLNKAWNKEYASWDSFAKGADSSFNTDAQKQDYSDLLYAYGVQYFGTVNSALKEVLPNHMYLGSRLPVWGMPDEIVKAAAENSDIITYNLYEEGIVPSEWEILEKVDAPSLIGEFSFGSDDAGHVHPGIIIASDQKDRGYMMKRYMETIVDNPYFVGVHMFQYMDGPISGRAYDGENYNTGMVNVADIPYKHMVKAAKEVHAELYQRRYGFLLEDDKK
ncbi:beta-galactosidase [Agaribacter marinus]|uniref:Hydrolase n=1 Tax=Agaribacter marinus TaxID=1431249 RepID=A0AA37T155_9ALTE|nr:beta-galactosidase [Agaribacter marinus]GLR71790.1 hydrolase [Agaribacter marinus]